MGIVRVTRPGLLAGFHKVRNWKHPTRLSSDSEANKGSCPLQHEDTQLGITGIWTDCLWEHWDPSWCLLELADLVIVLLVICLGKAFLMLQSQEILHKARSPRGTGYELKAFLKLLKEGADPKFYCRKVQV